MRHHRGILGGLLLVVAGILFLLNNIGMLPTGFWWALLDLWPALIIILGLDIIAEYSHSNLTAYAMYAAEALLLITVVLYAWSFPYEQAPSFLQYFPFLHVLENVMHGFYLS
ncbi:MAG: DUF5668 domain-containing protein [Methanolobus sp.]|nr:DUF5668 domain-containing protein [Methanolobus sp.]